MKKTGLIIFFLFISANLCFAITLLTEKEALIRILPEAEEITAQKTVVSQQQLDAIKKTLGGTLVYKVIGEGAEELNKQREFTFYFAKKENKLIGAAIILDEPGKWGPIKFIINLGPEGEIRDAAVMKYTETRGRPAASRNFLRQFYGKTLSDPIKLDKDIQGISGATISSHAACFVMKKAMVLYKILVLEQK